MSLCRKRPLLVLIRSGPYNGPRHIYLLLAVFAHVIYLDVLRVPAVVKTVSV